MASLLIWVIGRFVRVIQLLLLGRALLSWFVAANPYSSQLGRLYDVLVRLTEPIVYPCRAVLQRFNTGMIDFSVLLALFLLEIAESLLVRLILIIFT